MTTDSEDIAIAAAAMTGDSRMPKNGYRTPAATGKPLRAATAGWSGQMALAVRANGSA